MPDCNGTKLDPDIYGSRKNLIADSAMDGNE